MLAVLALLGILPFSAQTMATHSMDKLAAFAVVCMAANALGILGAVMVRTHNILGAIVMAAVMVIILCFGFPWQTIPAVIYIISFVMAAVPEKMHTEEI